MEFKIDITGTSEKYINDLILGFVHSGYEVYFDWDREYLIFTGHLEEVCDIKSVKTELEE